MYAKEPTSNNSRVSPSSVGSSQFGEDGTMTAAHSMPNKKLGFVPLIPASLPF